jgi:outer membrane protein assembly factor BamA
MMRFRLRTLLVFLAIGPPLLAVGYFYFVSHVAWRHRLEGHWVRQAKFLGNTAFSDKKLAKVTGVGQSVRLNAYSAGELVRKIRAFYFQQGFSEAKVTVVEGDRVGDRSLVFEIVEGERGRR